MEELTQQELDLINSGSFTVRNNLLTDSNYAPYCGSPYLPNKCSMPRMKWNSNINQFICPECGFVTEFPKDFIDYYKLKWNK